MELSIRWRHFAGACVVLAATAVGLQAPARDVSHGRKASIEQKKLSRDLPQTVIVRVKRGTHRVEIAQVKQHLSLNKSARALAKRAHFVKAGKNVRGAGEIAPSLFGWLFDCDEYYRYDNRWARSNYYDDYDGYDYNYDSSYWYYQPTYSYRGYAYPYSRYNRYYDDGYDYFYYGWNIGYAW